MKYFLIPDKGHEYKIMKVQNEDITSFCKRYAKQILLEADSIGELLIQFSLKLEELQSRNE